MEGVEDAPSAAAAESKKASNEMPSGAGGGALPGIAGGTGELSSPKTALSERRSSAGRVGSPSLADDATAAGDVARILPLMAEDVVFLGAGRSPMRGRRAFEQGLLVRVTGDIIALSPPLIIGKSHIDQVFGTLATTLKASV